MKNVKPAEQVSKLNVIPVKLRSCFAVLLSKSDRALCSDARFSLLHAFKVVVGLEMVMR